ncbi:hypothetical protein BDE36_2110 [Arcticibacter tournemirensis]|uniref:Uncharacterized protein n=1 Tax=Arcticibacter tournemirensis TaxID=699437 RepID=A0A4Q0MB63_9SPHI|nr:hypothetical protein [Arcticibacter tournemirensis]KAA8485347.1 hypothetical protein F1649_04305 [Arcticibacter tournemirensis]RXF70046.1 hypothetical protein EKH83_09150 [Arcticibacter tournemirensis]TQM50367.1 hypothetical protein BDE36_2110 [Arcticibacter tournemirensis]
MKSANAVWLGACALIISLQSCSTMGRLPSGVEIGSGVGERMGASLGKKSGNSAVGAVIGAAFCGSAGNLLDRYVAALTGANRPALYIINGIPYTRKKALNSYKHVQPGDIQSITRLNKDEAVARYGSLGEKGAVIIALNKTPEVTAE